MYSIQYLAEVLLLLVRMEI